MVNPNRRGRNPESLLQGSDKTRLIFIGVGFVLILGTFLGIQLWSRANEPETPKNAGGPGMNGPLIDVAPHDDAQGRPIFSHKPETPAERRDIAQDDLHRGLARFATKGELRDSDVRDSTPVLTWLLNEIYWNFRVTRVQEPYYERLNESDVLFEPAPHRGTFASAFGEVITVSPPEPFAGEVRDVGDLYRAVFRTEEGTLYHLTSATPIEFEIGDWVQAYGVFYRLRTLEIGEERKEAVSLVVSKELRRAFPPTTITEIDPAWAGQVRDKSFDEANNTDERPLWLILNYLRNFGLEGYRQKRDSGEIEPLELGDPAKMIIRLPDEYRFEHVSVKGRVIDTYVDILQSDNPGKIRRVDSAALLQPSGYLVRLISPRPWSEYGFQPGRDFVTVEGIFYKRWVYVPRGGGEAREIPLLLVTDVRLPEENGVFTTVIQGVMVLIAVGLVCLFIVVALKDKRKVDDFRRRYEEKKRARNEAGKSGE